MTMDDLTDLEHRLDQLETWRATEATLKRARAERNNAKHSSWQLLLAVVSSVTMVVNLYLTLTSHK